MKVRQVYGCRRGGRVELVDESLCVYEAGAYVVFMGQSEQELVKGGLRGISPNRKLIAVKENSTLLLYDIATLRKVKSIQLNAREVSFSGDSKQLLVVADILHLWNFAEAKKSNLKFSNTHIKNAQFNPRDPTLIAALCTDGIRFLRIVEDFRVVAHDKSRLDSNAMTWLLTSSTELAKLVVTSRSEICIYENFEVKTSIPLTYGAVGVLPLTSGGFVLGSFDGIRIFSSPNTSSFEQLNTPQVHNMKHMALSPTEETLLCSTPQGLQRISLTSGAMIYQSEFHEHKILKLTATSWKHFLVSIDQSTLKVWDTSEKKLLVSQNKVDITDISLHPSALFLLCATTSCVELIAMHSTQFRVVRTRKHRGAHKCQFANGGHIFALAEDSGGLRLISSYDFGQGAIFTTAPKDINAIKFDKGDRRLLAVGLSISLYQVNGLSLIPEAKLQLPASDAILDRRGLFCIAQNTMKRFNFQVQPSTTKKVSAAEQNKLMIVEDLNYEFRHDDHSSAVSCLESLSETIQVAGFSDGRLQLSSVAPAASTPSSPITTTTAKDEKCHLVEVSAMTLGGSQLFSAASDGTICQIETPQNEFKNSALFEDVLLIANSKITERKDRLKTLRSQLKSIIADNEKEQQHRDDKFKDKVNEIADKFNAELKNDKVEYSDVKKEKLMMETDFESRLEAKDQEHIHKVQSLKEAQASKISIEKERLTSFVEARQLATVAWEEKTKDVVESHTAKVNEIADDYGQKIQEEQREQAVLRTKKEMLRDKCEKAKSEIESDASIELQLVKSERELKLNSEKEINQILKEENLAMKKRYTGLTKDVEEHREEIRSLQDKERELIDAMVGLQKDIQGHKKEIRDREETMADKEKRIYDLRKKNQELEKFKFVLDYKIKELKRQIEPRESEIAEMRKQIEEMDLELDQYQKSNAALQLMISELRLKYKGMDSELHTQKAHLKKYTERLSGLRQSLGALVLPKLDDKHTELKNAVLHLYKASTTDAIISEKSSTKNKKNKNNERAREQLECNVDALKRKISRDLEVYLSDNARLLEESTQLLAEMNALRREQHNLVLRASSPCSLSSSTQPSSSLSAAPPRRCREHEEHNQKQLEFLRQRKAALEALLVMA